MAKFPEPLWKTNPIEYLVQRRFALTGTSVLEQREGRKSARTAAENTERANEVNAYRLHLKTLTTAQLNELVAETQAVDSRLRQARVDLEEQQRSFNQPSAKADFSFWASASYWSQDEAVALSFGRDPRHVTWKAIEPFVHNLDRLFDLQKYPFTALEIASSVDEEQVADIFVRINSEGVKLNQADFILTLLSVFWDEGRKELEDFCRQSRVVPSRTGEASPYNHFIEPDPDQLLRVSVAVGFGRGRLKSVYQILRGKDPDSAKVTVDLRDRQFEVLKQAQKKVLDLRNWHQFLKALVGAGYRAGEMISSQNALLYAYAFYLWGREELGVAEHILQRTIGRWFFFTSLTGRYTSSPESMMEQDLNRLKGTATGEEFVNLLNELIASELTNDYWTITLPSDLATSSARNPQLFAYVASQNRLGARVLFSSKNVAELIDPALRATKKPLERHHLFPRGWLEDNGVEDLREINQIANYALLEWPDNIDIGKKAPFDYFGEIEKRFADQPEAWNKMLADHALPDQWQSMNYPEFLQARRILMADIIRKGFESL